MELQDVEIRAEGLGFPEGPVAMADGSVVVCEINRGRLSRVATDREVTVVANVGGGPNGAAVGPDGALYVCNNGGVGREKTGPPAIQRVDPDSGAVDQLYTEWEGRAFTSPNDLVFDATGGFWFTDLGGNAIYYARPDGTSVERALRGLRAPNGIGLSPDGDVLYWAETMTRQVHRRRLSAPGQIVPAVPYSVGSLLGGNQPDPWTLLVGLPGAQELDSLAVDSSGAVCVGTLLESGVTVIRPDGAHEKFTLPDHLADGAVTNICFGGADLQTAYLTCSVTGRLVSCRWPRPGLQLAFPQAAGGRP
jgi:gluconolactonase